MMRILYFTCDMGAAGDMIMASLLDMLPDKKPFLERMNGLLPGVTVGCHTVEQQGIRGLNMTIKIYGEEESSVDYDQNNSSQIDRIAAKQKPSKHPRHPISLVESMNIPAKIKENAVSILNLLIHAQSTVHREPVTEIHFHALGNLDAVVDIVGVCLLIEELAPDFIFASPIHVGSGEIVCARGVLPVPAPATAQILRNVPIYGGEVQGELCTPTGAAILKRFVSAFIPLPNLVPQAMGTGFGKKAFSRPSYIHTVMGQAIDAYR